METVQSLKALGVFHSPSIGGGLEQEDVQRSREALIDVLQRLWIQGAGFGIRDFV